MVAITEIIILIIGNVLFSFSLNARMAKVIEPISSKMSKANKIKLGFTKVITNNIEPINEITPFFIFKQSLVSLYFCLFRENYNILILPV